ncbi:MAG: hypothetical protein GY754_26820 [bacterium]|nr:hypothetical protein [bacterium]
MKRILLLLLLSTFFVSTGCQFFSGPAGHWKFDAGSGTTVKDSSSNGNNGTLTGGAWLNGKIGDYALELDGENDFIEVPYNDDIFNAKSFTIAAWLTHDNGNRTAACFRKIGGWHVRTYGGQLDITFEDGDEMHEVKSGYTFPANEWHHYAIKVDTKDSDNGTVIFYVDGEQFGEVHEYTNGVKDSETGLYIGQYNELRRWKGSIDELRFYKEILSDSKIKKLYKEGQQKVFTALPSFNPPAGTYDEDIAVSFECSDTGAVFHYTTDGSEPTQSSPQFSEAIAIAGAGTTMTLKAIAVVDGKEASYVSTALYSITGNGALSGHWEFEEGTGVSVSDSTGNGNAGTLAGSPQWTEGKIGNSAMTFDGENDYVEIPYSNVIFNAEVFTAAVWLNSGNGTSRCAYIRRVGGWHMRTFDGEWDVVLEGGSTIKSGYYFPDSEWHHYAVIVNNTDCTVTFFLDGEQFGDVHSFTQGFTSSNGDFYIGQYSGGYRWNGSIDDVRFYIKALDASEISEIYQLGN